MMRAAVVSPAAAAPQPSTPAGGRRDDLDGLRGLAIALVAVFHIWFGRVSGGVDVFLVLSGYFFGGMVLRGALTPGSSLSPLRCWSQSPMLAAAIVVAVVVVAAAVGAEVVRSL